jgi:23S rRNA pseudouridine1911/1915/1917 synthase
MDELPFRILGETPDFLAVEKPALLLVHPTGPGGPLTLWDHLRKLLAYEIAGGGQVSLINRLDRETSGIVLVAKHHEAARAGCMAMERGEIGKEYLAIVTGWPQRERWHVEAPLLRLGEVMPSRIWLKRGVDPCGAPARTEFQVKEKITHPKHGPLALVLCKPLTGRTHQIRVHLAHSGHPVVGDKIYGPSEECYLEFIETGWSPALEEKLWLRRHALHASLLRLNFLGESHCWTSELPKDLQSFLGSDSLGNEEA